MPSFISYLSSWILTTCFDWCYCTSTHERTNLWCHILLCTLHTDYCITKNGLMPFSNLPCWLQKCQMRAVVLPSLLLWVLPMTMSRSANETKEDDVGVNRTEFSCDSQQVYENSGNQKKVLFLLCLGLCLSETDGSPLFSFENEPWPRSPKTEMRRVNVDFGKEIVQRARLLCIHPTPQALNWPKAQKIEWLVETFLRCNRDISLSLQKCSRQLTVDNGRETIKKQKMHFCWRQRFYVRRTTHFPFDFYDSQNCCVLL
jgi:hypothetical protein